MLGVENSRGRHDSQWVSRWVVDRPATFGVVRLPPNGLPIPVDRASEPVDTPHREHVAGLQIVRHACSCGRVVVAPEAWLVKICTAPAQCAGADLLFGRGPGWCLLGSGQDPVCTGRLLGRPPTANVAIAVVIGTARTSPMPEARVRTISSEISSVETSDRIGRW